MEKYRVATDYLQRPNPDSLTVVEIADSTGFSRNTVYSWCREELLPFKRGKHGEILITRKSLERFLKRYYGGFEIVGDDDE